MNRSQIGSALGLGLLGGVFAYFVATERGRRTGAASADWLRSHRPDFSPQLGRIEHQIEALGTDLRGRLDALQQQIQPGVDVDWTVSRDDFNASLRDLPR